MFELFNGLLLAGEGAASSIDWSSIITANSFAGMLDGINDVLPVVVPVALTVAAIPVVWKLTKRFIRG